MNIKVEINLDWIEEGGHIDNEIKEVIIDKVVRLIEPQLRQQLDALVADKLNHRVDDLINDLWKNFMEKPLNITDKYGDTIAHHDSVKDMLKARLDDFLDQKVDSNGKAHPPGKSCPYGAKPRIEWLLDSRIEHHTKDFVEKTSKEFDVKLKNALNEGLKAKLSETLLKSVDVNKALAG